MAKITSLFSEKKVKIVAGVLTVALITGGAVVISNVASADEAWTAFLSFFGKANVTGNVWQSVLLDGGRYNAGDDTRTQSYTTSDIFAGETTRSYHELENRSSVQQKVRLATSYSPGSIADYITTTYWKSNTIQTKEVGDADCPITLTITDKGETTNWHFQFDTETCAGLYGNRAYALMISLDQVHPLFQIHSNDGVDHNFDFGEHLYSEWVEGQGFNGWLTGTDGNNIKVTDMEGITATGKRPIAENQTGEFEIEIHKDYLNNQDIVYIATSMTDHPNVYRYPAGWVAWSGDASEYEAVTLEERIWHGNVTLQPNETIDFVMSNETANNLVCKGCTVTATVEPR